MTALEGTMGTAGVWSVAYGSGCLSQAVERELARSGAARVLVVTSPAALASGPFGDLSAILGDRLAEVYDGVVPHVPRQTVFHARSAFVASSADAIISFGGGATTDVAKALRLVIGFDLEGPESFDEVPQGIVADAITHIAIPTTVSGAEFSPATGVTDDELRRKIVISRPGLAPNVTVIDSRVTAATPTPLWATGVVKALGDAIEKIMEVGLAPHLEPLVLEAASWLLDSLQPANLERDEARLRAQLASWSTVFAGIQSGASIGAATVLRHLLGPALGIPHAAVSAVLLPQVYQLDRTAIPRERHERLARALGLPADEPTTAVAGLLADTIAAVPVASRLRDLGVNADQIIAVAPAAAHEIRRTCVRHQALTDGAVTEMLLAAF